MGNESGNDKKKRETLKGILRDLHSGVELSILKRRFAELVKEVGPEEIPRLEQELMKEGLPQEEITRLCDVHVELFKDSLERQTKPAAPAGHLLHTMSRENQALRRVAEELLSLLEELGDPPSAERYPGLADQLARRLDDLAQVEKHYLKKENLLFPFLEKHGITAPPQVMWTIHDQARGLIKKTREAMKQGDLAAMGQAGKEAVRIVSDMVYKEDNILFPLLQKTLTDGEWEEAKKGEAEIGHVLTEEEKAEPARPAEARALGEETGRGFLRLEEGVLSPKQINLILTRLTSDITFVDENDEVKYYSAGRERIFPRSPAVIGRKVQMCHPPKSVHVVNRILSAFRSGEKDEAAFWIHHQGRFIYILYRALRDGDGVYQGCLEISQDLTGLRKLEGERRLLDWPGDAG